jgi:hypothetical protein
VSDLAAVGNRAFKGKVKQRLIFDNTVAYSTIAKVDPSLNQAAAEKRYGVNAKGEKDLNSQKMQDYRNLRENYWNKLTPDQQNYYNELRNYYAKNYEELRKLVKQRIDEFATDPDVKRDLSIKLLDEILNKEALEPYFPLSRSGKFWLEYEGINPFTNTVELFKHSFDSEKNRNLAALEVRRDSQRVSDLAKLDVKGEERLKVREYDRAESANTADRVPTSFAYNLLNEVRKLNAGAEIENLLTETLLNAMPENSMARMFRPRAGTMGFEMDAISVLQDRSRNFITQTANLKFDGKMSKLSQKMKAEADLSADPHKTVWLDSFNNYINYSRSPFIAPISRTLKGLGFLYTLGFNPSSVVVNATNPGVVTYPYLGGLFGFGRAAKAMLNASKLYIGSTRGATDVPGVGKTKLPLVGKRKSTYEFEFMDDFIKEDGLELDFSGGPSISNFDYDNPSKLP